MAIAHAQDFSRVRAASAAALPLLADRRFPSGGHAHSGGLEAAVALEHVDDLPALESFLRGRLHTAGVVAASFAAAACAVCSNPHGLERGTMLEFEAELDARMPSPALRSASRKLGRQLLRAGRTVWPHPHLDELSRVARQGVHHPIALGAVAAAAGLSARDAALVTVHESCASAATAAVRLLGLDPFAAYALLRGFRRNSMRWQLKPPSTPNRRRRIFRRGRRPFSTCSRSSMQDGR